MLLICRLLGRLVGKEFNADLLPGDRRIWVAAVLCPARVDECRVGLGERQQMWLGAERVPEHLDELEALRGRQLRDVEGGADHDRNLRLAPCRGKLRQLGRDLALPFVSVTPPIDHPVEIEADAEEIRLELKGIDRTI